MLTVPSLGLLNSTGENFGNNAEMFVNADNGTGGINPSYAPYAGAILTAMLAPKAMKKSIGYSRAAKSPAFEILSDTLEKMPYSNLAKKRIKSNALHGANIMNILPGSIAAATGNYMSNNQYTDTY